MAVRFSDLRAGRFLPPGRFLETISVRSCVHLKVIVRLEELSKLKNPPHPGLEGAIFQLVA
jgi:hypothetical protein